ncbi:hypothetical protein scyTo_0016065, partial [Scyliorhinus torazame]|nr:hypothetical protein [Scyliorhinus torazame]
TSHSAFQTFCSQMNSIANLINGQWQNQSGTPPLQVIISNASDLLGNDSLWENMEKEQRLLSASILLQSMKDLVIATGLNLPDQGKKNSSSKNIVSIGLVIVAVISNACSPQKSNKFWKRYCAHWNYAAGKSYWSLNGCHVSSSKNVYSRCQCDHLSGLALLISPDEQDNLHPGVIAIIATVVLCVSVVCLGISVMTFALCSSLKSALYATHMHLCWLNVNRGLVWSFLGPVYLIIAVNTVLFFTFLWILKREVAKRDTQVSKLNDTRMMTFKAIAQIFVLGCTWILGIGNVPGGNVVMFSIFTIINSLQGTFIFILLCVLNPKVCGVQ